MKATFDPRMDREDDRMGMEGIQATAVVTYRGTIRAVTRVAVQPVDHPPTVDMHDIYRRRVHVYGMPGSIVNIIA